MLLETMIFLIFAEKKEGKFFLISGHPEIGNFWMKRSAASNQPSAKYLFFKVLAES